VYAVSKEYAANSGPNVGTPQDASFQVRTGSTDLIVGAYYYRVASQNFDAFVNGWRFLATSSAPDC
jgi:hypothetical protein